MKYINKITNQASQKVILTGIPNLQITMTLRFMPRIAQWIMGINYADVSIQGIPIVTSLNLLRQFDNNLPFGISCVRTDNLDPYTLSDFADQVANLYLLTADDIASLNSSWFE